MDKMHHIAISTERIDLIDEYDGGFPFSRQRKEFFHQSKEERRVIPNLALSPCHLETRSADDTLKNVLLHTVATAFAR